MARVKGALGGVPQVKRVDFSPQEESFAVEYEGARPLGQVLADKVMSVVIVPGFRKTLEEIGQKLKSGNHIN